MGDIADMDRDYDGLDPFDDETVEVWTTREGEEIPIPSLTDSHLLNAYRFLIRIKGDSPLLELLLDEIRDRRLEEQINAD